MSRNAAGGTSSSSSSSSMCRNIIRTPLRVVTSGMHSNDKATITSVASAASSSFKRIRPVLTRTALAQQQQPRCCFPRLPPFCVNFSSSSLGGGGSASINRRHGKDNNEGQQDAFVHEDALDFDEDEEDDDHDKSNDVYGTRHESQWYQKLHCYEEQLLREQMQQIQSTSNESPLSHGETTRTSRRRPHDWLLFVPTSDEALMRWMKQNRHKYKRGVLSKERQESIKNMLERVISSSSTTSTSSISVEEVGNHAQTDEEEMIDATIAARRLLEPRSEYWREMYQHLCTFVQDHDGNFPYDYARDNEEISSGIHNKHLWDWCQQQKKDYKACQHHKQEQQQEPRTISIRINTMEERIQKLEALGFVWDGHDKSWNERYQELKAYKQHHGDCLVPSDYPLNPALSRWVSDQRTMYWRYIQQEQQKQKQHQTSGVDSTTTKDEMSAWSLRASCVTPRRLALLQELDFCWNALGAKWMQRYRELQEHMCINNTVFDASASASCNRIGDNNDQTAPDAGGGRRVMMMTPPNLPSGPLKRWLVVQKKKYKEYLSTCSTNMNSPPPAPQHKQHHEKDDDDDNDQQILAKQLTLEKRFQLLHKLGFPWE
jgi:Helicase associated domain